MPFTVKVKPFGWQYGVDANGGVEIDVIVGAAVPAALIVKFTTFDFSVVVVAFVLDDPETADPGICTAI